MSGSQSVPSGIPQRLCSEIQLFDLCDLDSCTCKVGRFCTDSELLTRFEKIADDERQLPDRYAADEFDDPDGYDEENDELEMDDYAGGEDDSWEDD